MYILHFVNTYVDFVLHNHYLETTFFKNYMSLKSYSSHYKEIKTRKLYKIYLPHGFWCDDCGTYIKACNLIGDQLELYLYPTKRDYYGIFRQCLSYVEVELIGNISKTIRISLSHLEDLYNECKT